MKRLLLMCVVSISVQGAAAEEKKESLFSRLAKAAARSDQQAIITAAQTGDCELINTLLEAKADPNEELHVDEWRKQSSPLVVAAAKNQPEAVILLLSKKIGVHQKAKALMHAVLTGHSDIACDIASSLPYPQDSSYNRSCHTSMIFASAADIDPLTMDQLLLRAFRPTKIAGHVLPRIIRDGKAATAHMILDMHKPKVDIADPCYALSYAARREDLRLMQKIIRANPSQSAKGEALFFAVKQAYIPGLRLLLGAQPDVNYQYRQDAWNHITPLNQAYKQMRPDLVCRIMWHVWRKPDLGQKKFAHPQDQNRYLNYMEPPLRLLLKEIKMLPFTHDSILQFLLPLPKKPKLMEPAKKSSAKD